MFKNELCEYELCLSLIYNGNVNYAITVMDGLFFSIYPYTNENKYTVTDVEYTPLFTSSNFNNLLLFEKNITDDFIMNTK
jgi:hypothetical protein